MISLSLLWLGTKVAEFNGKYGKMRKASYTVFLSLSLDTQAEITVWVLMRETSGNTGQHPHSALL